MRAGAKSPHLLTSLLPRPFPPPAKKNTPRRVFLPPEKLDHEVDKTIDQMCPLRLEPKEALRPSSPQD